MKTLIIEIFYSHGYAYHSETVLDGVHELEFLRNGLIVKVRKGRYGKWKIVR